LVLPITTIRIGVGIDYVSARTYNAIMKQYTSVEVAKKLGYTERHIRRLIENYKIWAEKVGNEWLIPEPALTAFNNGKKLSIIKGGLSEVDEGFYYYFGVSEMSYVYGPRFPVTREHAEEILINHIEATKDQFDDDWEVHFERIDKNLK